jgi:transposase
MCCPPAVHTTVVVQSPAPAPAPPVPVPPQQPRVWRDVVGDILRFHQGALFEKERIFLPDLLRKGFAPRGGQVEWLAKIVRRTGVRPWDIAP